MVMDDDRGHASLSRQWSMGDRRLALVMMYDLYKLNGFRLMGKGALAQRALGLLGNSATADNDGLR